MKIKFGIPSNHVPSDQYSASITMEAGATCIVDFSRREITVVIDPVLDELGKPRPSFTIDTRRAQDIVAKLTELGLIHLETVLDWREQLAIVMARFLGK